MKNEAKIVGRVMFIYCLCIALIFSVYISIGIWHGQTFIQIINKHGFPIGTYNMFLLFVAWLIYLISSIGVMTNKHGARTLGLCISGVVTLFFVWYWVRGFFPTDSLNPLNLNAIFGWMSIGAIFVFIPLGAPSLLCFMLLSSMKKEGREGSSVGGTVEGAVSNSYTMVCPKCGKKYDKTWKVCLNCRVNLEKAF